MNSHPNALLPSMPASLMPNGRMRKASAIRSSDVANCRGMSILQPRAHPGKERREQRSAEHDADGVDVLNPLRLNLHGTDHQVDVVDREQHQAARRHLIE